MYPLFFIDSYLHLVLSMALCEKESQVLFNWCAIVVVHSSLKNFKGSITHYVTNT